MRPRQNDVCLLLDSRGMGGIESHVAELALGLRDRKRDVRVVLLQDHGSHPLRTRLANAGLACDALPGGFIALLRYLRGNRPAVLHTHGYKANLLGRLAAVLLGIPVVATFHAGEQPEGRVKLYDRADRWTAKLGARIAVSAAIASRLPCGATVIPNFVEVPVAPCPPGPPVVAFVGRLVPEKGPDLFLKLAEALPDLEFRIYGAGPLSQMVAGNPRVDFRGARDGMASTWPEIGLLAISSRAEGLPLAALEAMAHGVPVATFSVGGLPDLIEHGSNGYLAPAGQVAELAACVATWHSLEPEARRRMSEAARRRVQDGFARAAGVSKTLAVYDASRAVRRG